MNSFWHNHYEKVILATLLIIFCGLLLYQTKLIQANRSNEVEKIVSTEEPKPDFKPLDYDVLPEFQADNVYSAGIEKWADWTRKKEAVPGDISDMMTTPPLSLCPYCINLVSAASFPEKLDVKPGQNADEIAKKNAKECPYCKASLKPRASSQTAFVAEGEEKVAEPDKDRNNNDIDDEIELKYGMSIDKDESGEDPDKDGFTSREEIEAATNPVDPKSHPALISKLFLDGKPANVSFEDCINKQVNIDGRQVKSIRILGNDTTVSPDGKNVSLALQVVYLDSDLRNQIFYLKIGSLIPYHKAGSHEKAKDVNAGLSNFRFTKFIAGADMASHVFIFESGDLKLEAKADKQIGTPFFNVKFRHVLHDNGIATFTDKEFEIGNAHTGTEKYIVTKIVSGKDPSVILTSVADKKQYTIKQEIKKEPAGDDAQDNDAQE